MRVAISFLFVVALSGCATHTELTLISQPEGAFITHHSSGQQYGVAPVTVYYDHQSLKRRMGNDGCYYVSGFTAKWVSGATTVFGQIQLCGKLDYSYSFQFNRDINHPDLEKDMNFVLKLQTLRAQQAQANASKKAADAAFMSAIQSMMTKPQPIIINQPSTYEPNYQKQLNCTSRRLGNTVYTDCY